jgi:hypothetical protein
VPLSLPHPETEADMPPKTADQADKAKKPADQAEAAKAAAGNGAAAEQAPAEPPPPDTSADPAGGQKPAGEPRIVLQMPLKLSATATAAAGEEIPLPAQQAAELVACGAAIWAAGGAPPRKSKK